MTRALPERDAGRWPEEVPMSIAESRVTVMLPITDPDRAQQFYGECLGLAYDGRHGADEVMYQLAGGARLVLRVLPDAHPSPNTAMSFEVADVTAEVAALESRGVTFEDYDSPGFTSVGHIVDDGDVRAAWFLDPDRNVLCLHQVTG
jgi:catechol 2,3-dioxygenase-like lactoylglutathione lyase family enzyme